MNAVYMFVARLVVAAMWDVLDPFLSAIEPDANAINTEQDET